MNKRIGLVVLAPLSAFASELTLGDLKLEATGNVEAQARHSTNPQTARDFPLRQRWRESNFSVLSANLGLRAQFQESRAELNWFSRQANSALYQRGYVAPRIMNFPNRLIARDVFRLNYSRQDGDQQTDSVLNKFTYELDGDDSRFTIGRMYINYGAGEIFNPINPFNQPLGLVGATNVAQGNDGARASFFLSERSSLSFFLLGDKQLAGDEDKVTRTLWLHWEYRLAQSWQFDVVGGEDQKRNKAGGQVNYLMEDAMVFLQALYSSEYVDGNPSENLWDVMLGYDNQFTPLWHTRVEMGYQETDRELGLAPTRFTGRYLPYEYFAALANSYEIHPLWKLSGTVIHDVKTHFGYGLGKATWSVMNNLECDFFVFSPLYHGNKRTLVQRLITTDVGTALRYFF